MKEFYNKMWDQHVIKHENDLNETMINVGSFCKHYRINVLNKTRKEIAKDISEQTLYHFENGNSTNMLHYIRYYRACDTVDQQLDFIKGVHEIMDHLG